jgi:hypothetical protein
MDAAVWPELAYPTWSDIAATVRRGSPRVSAVTQGRIGVATIDYCT